MMVPMGMFVCSSFWAQIIGPMVLVWRWNANSSNELHLVSVQTLKKRGLGWCVEIKFGGYAVSVTVEGKHGRDG